MNNLSEIPQREWEDMACLTEKEWQILKVWVQENEELACDTPVVDIVEIAKINKSQFQRWHQLNDINDSDSEKKQVRMKCHKACKSGWSPCKLGPSKIDANSIQEAMNLAGLAWISG